MNRTASRRAAGSLGLALCGVLLLGCPSSGEIKTASETASLATLPTDAPGLFKVADEQSDLGMPKNALLAVEKAQQMPGVGASYDVQWRTARAYSELCEPESESDQKLGWAQQGMQAAKRAVEMEANRVEGHYYLAQLQGHLALLQKGETKTAIQQFLSAGEAAQKIDEKYDYGGPLRLIGVLYARAPREPVSIGDPEKAVKFLERAKACAPDFPPNQIYLAEALVLDERYADAEAALLAGKRALAQAKWAGKRAVWQELYSRVERKLKAKQN